MRAVDWGIRILPGFIICFADCNRLFSIARHRSTVQFVQVFLSVDLRIQLLCNRYPLQYVKLLLAAFFRFQPAARLSRIDGIDYFFSRRHFPFYNTLQHIVFQNPLFRIGSVPVYFKPYLYIAVFRHFEGCVQPCLFIIILREAEHTALLRRIARECESILFFASLRWLQGRTVNLRDHPSVWNICEVGSEL